MYKQLADVSLKSLDMINKNAEGLNKLAEFLKEMQDNQNLLATKVMKLEKKYYGGINKVLGEPWFTKTDAEIEAEAEKKVKEFMDRNS